MSDYNPFADRDWSLAHGQTLQLGPTAQMMGILNVTPDSFSDGGLFDEIEAALYQANAMLEQGAVIIDVGGESTRPGAASVGGVEEEKRVLPIIEALSGIDNVLISIDTYRSTTARAAVEAGAHIINDVWGCQKDPAIADVAAETGAGLCLMHTGRGRDILPDPIDDQLEYLSVSLGIARQAGVREQQMVLDPGFGFAKETADENLHLMNRLEELHSFGLPLLIGTSRKRFLGAITGREAMDRDVATSATSVVARQKGAALFRVHDVASNKDALAVVDALLNVSAGAN